MSAIFTQILVLFVFMLAGWLLKKGKLLDASHSKILSALEVYLFCPCISFNSFAEQCTAAYLSEKYPLILLSVGILGGLWVLSHCAAKCFSRDTYARTVYAYSIMMPNYGFMGYALCSSLFGSLALLDLMIFSLPMNLYVASVGFLSLTRKTGKDLKPIHILTPSMIASLLGCLVGLTGLRLPTVLMDVSNSAAACMAPVAMLLAGVTVAQFSLKELLWDKRTYAVTALRLVGVPVLLFTVLKLLGLGSALATVLSAYAMPCGLNTVVYPKLIGEDCRIGASLALISSLAALITVPLCLSFLV